MNAPVWLNDIVRDFGRQMALKDFALNERGAAGLRFENGVNFRLEYAFSSLMVSTGLEVAVNEGTMKKLLMTAHPSTRSPVKIRAFRLGNEARFAVRLPEREVSVTSLQGAFTGLWRITEDYRRSIA